MNLKVSCLIGMFFMDISAKAFLISLIITGNIYSEELHPQVQLANEQMANIMVPLTQRPVVLNPQTGNVWMQQIVGPMQNVTFHQNLQQQLPAINNVRGTNIVVDEIDALAILQARLRAVTIHNDGVIQF